MATGRVTGIGTATLLTPTGRVTDTGTAGLPIATLPAARCAMMLAGVIILTAGDEAIGIAFTDAPLDIA